MGQVQSGAESSLGSRIDEATAYGREECVELIDKGKALECPCIAQLRSGPCGDIFSRAFLCFLNSTSQEKGSDCVHPFVALQNCIKANPDAFSKDQLPPQDYKIYPPKWSQQPKPPKSKL